MTPWTTLAIMSMRSSRMMMRVRTGRWKFSVVTLKSSWSWQMGREQDIEARRIAEGRHRLLQQIARARLQFEWMFCFDPDERVTGDLRGFLAGPLASECDGMRFGFSMHI